MPRRSPYQIGRAHGLAGLPQFSHHKFCRPYDSANANMTYRTGFYQGQRERQFGAKYDMFALFGVDTPSQSKPRS